MKILLLSTYDTHGGAAQAAYRLFQGLKIQGVEVRMLVLVKGSQDEQVWQPTHFSYKRYGKFRGYLDLLPGILLSQKKILFSIGWLSSRSVEKAVRDFDPDVIHLHWINKGFINLKSLVNFNKPIVWTLHDMWAFTGGCHYAFDCERFMTGCGQCPVLHSRKKGDLSHYLYHRKKNIYHRIRSLSIVTPSRWLTKLASDSGIFNGHPALTIPNAINVQVFHDKGMNKARQGLGLPADKKLILFNAMNATRDERKGYSYLLEALKIIGDPAIELVVVGATELSGKEPENLKIHLMGLIRDVNYMADIYSACNVFVLPSLQDNLPNTVMESLACSRPVVAFHTGGIPDMVVHEQNGYLADYKSSDSLARGLLWVLNHPDAEELYTRARQKILAEFSEQVVIQKHLDLYQKLSGQ